MLGCLAVAQPVGIGAIVAAGAAFGLLRWIPDDRLDVWCAAVAGAGAVLLVVATVVGNVMRRQVEGALSGVVDDLARSARARASELARANAELARAGRDRGEYFASMSHELRTPLNGILGYSNLLIDGLDGELNEDQRESVAHIRSSGHGLLAVVNDVLDLSKLAAGRIAFRRDAVHCQTLVDDVLGRLRPLAIEAGLTLANEVPSDLPPALADEARLIQVMTNFVANAISFTERGGVTVRGAMRDGMVQLAVTDSGVGIPAESHELIFEPFRQADQRDTRRHGGTGLGLAICRSLVTGMGGGIELESAPGRGSTFRITLPSAVAVPDAVDAAAEEGDARPLAIGMMRDDGATAELARVYERAGLRFARADDVADLGGIVARHLPSVVILDLLAPGARGWQALRALRDDASGRAVPALLYAAEGARTLCLPAGPTDFLLRPADGQIVARLDELRADGACAPVRKGARRVLVAVDDPMVGEDLTRQLEAAGYEVGRAATASDACELLARHAVEHDAQPDPWHAARRGTGHDVAGVVLSLLLPGAPSLLARLRGNEHWADLPILLVSPPRLSAVELRALHHEVLDLVRTHGVEGAGPADAATIDDALRRALGHAPRACAPAQAGTGTVVVRDVGAPARARSRVLITTVGRH